MTRRTKINEDRISKMVQRYSEGMSTTDVGRLFGVTPTTAARYLKTAGVKLREPGFRRGKNHHAWTGGKITNSSGYVMVRIFPDDPLFCMAIKKAEEASYVLEHRLIVARKLGRPLADHETVHHIDGNKKNNHPDNLQLRSGRHGKGVVLRCLDCGSHNISAAHLE